MKALSVFAFAFLAGLALAAQNNLPLDQAARDGGLPKV
jgi:hypothetical protein